MAINTIKTVGINSAGAYQVSGTPFLTGSSFAETAATVDGHKISFPLITKSVTVINKAAFPFVVHFASRAGTGNIMGQKRYITLTNSGDSFTFDVKCREIFLSSVNNAGNTCIFELFAEITPIASDFNLSGSVGVTKGAGE
tara:strand:+ start:821 stop:1243 length:423 start_codon:yes stop_codon:yes gene_type:complete